MRTADGLGPPNAIAVDATAPLTRGYVDVLAGRAPRAADRGGADRTGHEAARSAASVARSPAATARDRTQWSVRSSSRRCSHEVVLFAPLPEVRAAQGFGLQHEWLVDTPAPDHLGPGARAQPVGHRRRLARRVHRPATGRRRRRSFAAAPVTRELAVGVLVGGLALLEIVLLAGPAFAVERPPPAAPAGAGRRQRRHAGPCPAHRARRRCRARRRRRGRRDRRRRRRRVRRAAVHRGATSPTPRAGGYRVFPAALAAIAALAVVTGAARRAGTGLHHRPAERRRVAGRAAGRHPVAQALDRRRRRHGRPRHRAGRRRHVLGRRREAMLAGLVLGELGLVLCTPALVGLVARIGRLLPLAPRIALRDAARNRAVGRPGDLGRDGGGRRQRRDRACTSTATGRNRSSSTGFEFPIGSVQASLASAGRQGWPEQARSDPPNPADVEAVLRRTLPVVGGATCVKRRLRRSVDPERFCGLMPRSAPGQACPYAEAMAERALTAAEQRAARGDHRCDDTLYGGPSGNDARRRWHRAGRPDRRVGRRHRRPRRRVLRAGGVVVRDARLFDNGRATSQSSTRPRRRSRNAEAIARRA